MAKSQRESAASISGGQRKCARKRGTSSLARRRRPIIRGERCTRSSQFPDDSTARRAVLPTLSLLRPARRSRASRKLGEGGETRACGRYLHRALHSSFSRQRVALGTIYICITKRAPAVQSNLLFSGATAANQPY